MGFLSSLFGVSDRTPKTSTVVQTSKLPEELSPFVKDVLGEAQTMYQAETERGYDPYTGEMIAGFTPQEEQALVGLEGLVGTTKPFLDEALQTYRQGGEQFTGDTAQQYMSPYQQAVTDIEKREAQRNFEGTVMPQFEAKAIQQGGGMSGLGTRAGIEAAELQRGQSQLLADIQARGQQAAFLDASKRFEQQKAREQQMAGNVGRTGTAQLAAGIQEQGALQSVGEQRRGMGQAVLDEAYGRFLEEKNFPKQTLSDYSSTIYGAAPSFNTGAGTKSTSGLPGAPSMGQQLLGLGMAGLNSFNSGTFGNIFSQPTKKLKGGGPVIEAQTGLSIEDQINKLKQRRQPLLGNPRAARYRTATPKYKEAVGITDQINFLQEIQKEDEAKIQQAMQNQFKNFPPDQARKLAMDTLQIYTPSQAGGRGSGKGIVEAYKGLTSLVNPTVNINKQPAGQPAGQPARQQSAEQKQINNTINTLTNMVKYGKQPGQPSPTDTVGLKKIDQLGSGQAFTTQQPDVDKLITDRERSISESDPRFNVDAQRERKTNALSSMITNLRTNLDNKVKIQEEGYTEEDAKLNTFLNETEESIREDGATTSDIMADAIDQGMKEPTIVTMLTKVLNVNEKGVQKRAREVNKELRNLNKQKFIMEKESRKEKRTNKLINAEKESEIALKKIAGDLQIKEDLDKIPSDLKKQAMAELTAISGLKTNDLNRSLEVYKVIAKYKELAIRARKNEIDGTNTGKGTGKAFTAPEKQVDSFAASKFGYVIDGDSVKDSNNNIIDASMPAFKKFKNAQSIGRRVYKQNLQQLGTGYNAQVVAQSAAEEAINNFINKGGTSGGQAGSNQNNPMSLTGMTQAQFNSLPSGTFIRVPDPKLPGQFKIQKVP